jgi:GntR family transcriptional regulator/MocR family aminotransferase
VLSPALRLVFLVAPPSLRDALAKAKFLTAWHSANPGQAALAQFIDEGGFAGHIRKTRREYEAGATWSPKSCGGIWAMS